MIREPSAPAPSSLLNVAWQHSTLTVRTDAFVPMLSVVSTDRELHEGRGVPSVLFTTHALVQFLT